MIVMTGTGRIESYGGCVAAVQRSAIAAMANVVARVIAPLHIIL